jgi:hypothetical protein
MDIIAVWFILAIISSILGNEILAMGIFLALAIAGITLTPNLVTLIIVILLSTGLIKSFMRQSEL